MLPLVAPLSQTSSFCALGLAIFSFLLLSFLDTSFLDTYCLARWLTVACLVGRELQTLHSLRRMFVQDLRARVRRAQVYWYLPVDRRLQHFKIGRFGC